MNMINRIVVFIFCVCFTNNKDIAGQSQIVISIYGCFVAPYNQNSRQDLDISSCESLLPFNCDFRNEKNMCFNLIPYWLRLMTFKFDIDTLLGNIII